jgi:hypothetical protein
MFDLPKSEPKPKSKTKQKPPSKPQTKPNSTLFYLYRINCRFPLKTFDNPIIVKPVMLVSKLLYTLFFLTPVTVNEVTSRFIPKQLLSVILL